MYRPYVFPTKPAVYTDHDDIGVFDRLYEINDINTKERDILARWLCNNCTSNFVMVEIASRMIAGGSTDLKNSWKRYSRDVLKTYHVKLHRSDVMLFELCWLTESTGVLY